MIKKQLTAITILCILFCGMNNIFAKDAVFSGTDYAIQLSYTDTACPGDAVFIRMNFTDNAKHAKKQTIATTTANAYLYLGEKEIATAPFFLLSDTASHSKFSLLAGVPLSSWWQAENTYQLKVIYSFEGRTNMEFTLPFTMIHKEFVNETLPLDEANSSIKTDTSPERMKQIERLNAILETFDTTAVYQATRFTPPTTSTRRTAFFADRRVYTYTNGNSSTSLHYGTDYGVPTGTPVTACADGKVVLAENRISTGWSVVVEHLPGLYSLYYHMSVLNVKEGDLVKMGDKLGLSGATGLATGPHLHWEVRLNLCAVNPDVFTTDFAFSNTAP